jgi:hypothetical protein
MKGVVNPGSGPVVVALASGRLCMALLLWAIEGDHNGSPSTMTNRNLLT